MAKGRKPGTALDVGMGQGRNAIWLAQQGWDSQWPRPREKRPLPLLWKLPVNWALHFKSEIQRMEDSDFGESRWDMIVLSYVGGP